jgi:hypothetical protein
MVSRIPPASPAAIMLVKRSSKALGCLRMASARVAPPSTSMRVCCRILAKVLFSCWLPRISRHWTRGRPASIMTENWRVKMARSLEPTPPPSLGRAISLPFSLTEETRICSRRSRVITASLLSATRSPEMALPSLVLPFHT